MNQTMKCQQLMCCAGRLYAVIAVGAVGGVGLCTQSALGDLPTVYTQEQAFYETGSATLKKQSFEEIESGEQTSYSCEGVTLACEAGYTMRRHNAASRATDGARSVMITDARQLVLTFDSPVNAVGFQLIDFADAGEPADLVVTTDTGEVVKLLDDFYGRNGEAHFVGVTTAEPFTQLTVTTTVTNDGFYLDECYFGQVEIGEVMVSAGE